MVLICILDYDRCCQKNERCCNDKDVWPRNIVKETKVCNKPIHLILYSTNNHMNGYEISDVF